MLVDLSDIESQVEVSYLLAKVFRPGPPPPRTLGQFREKLAVYPLATREIHLTYWGEFSAAYPDDAAVLHEVMAELQARRPDMLVTFTADPVEVEVTIDLSGVTDSRELHRILKRELGFPDMYGMNWDAFWDAITALVPLPGRIRFTGWAGLEASCPRDASLLRELLAENNAKYSAQVDVAYEDQRYRRRPSRHRPVPSIGPLAAPSPGAPCGAPRATGDR